MPRPHSPLAATLCLALLAGCQESAKESRTTLVRKIALLPGESEMAQMEDERALLGGGLKRWFGHSDPKTRRRAALAAGRLQDHTSAGDLKALFADPDKDVRGMAAYAAGLLGDPAFAPNLEALFADESYYVRSSALLARSQLGGAQVPDAVRALLAPDPGNESSRALAGEAAVAVTRFQDPSIAPLLLPLLALPDPETRWRAAYGLYRFGQGGAELAPLLHDGDPRVRAYAALGVAAARHLDAVPDLAGLLVDPDLRVVEAAASALGTLRDARAADPLVALARSEVPRRRWAGIYGLSQGGLAATELTALFADPSPYVRSLAIDGLRRARTGRETVARAVKDPEWRVRAAAARAVADFGDSETLAKVLQYDEDARVIPPVLEGLARLDYSGLGTVLLKHLTDKDPVVRATAARLVSGRRLPGTAERLVASWENYSRIDEILVAKLAVLEALAQAAGRDDTFNPLRQAVTDSNWLVRTRAFQLLSERGLAGSLEAPARVGSLRTETFYEDMVSRADYDLHLNLVTEHGKLVFRLYPKLAPLNARFLEEVASSLYYDGKTFTGLVPGQELSDGDDRGDGAGYYPSWVRDEPHDTPFTKTQLTIRRPFGRDSGVSQFLITSLPRPDLDGVATPIGELLEGEAVLEALVPGETIRGVTVTAHEFRGKFVVERVQLDRPVVPGPARTTEPSGPALGTAPVPGGWQLPPPLIYLTIVGGVMLIVSLLPVVVSAERREDMPLAMWVIIGLILIVAGAYTYLVLTGDYFQMLTAERPGPRVLEKPNPPILSADLAMLACTVAMGYVMLELALLYFLVSGKSFARWLFLFLSLIEIALFTAQIATGTTLFSVISQVGIAINLLKIWFLLMDRQTKEYLAPA